MDQNIREFNRQVNSVVEQIQIVEQYSVVDGAEAAQRRYLAEGQLYRLLAQLKLFAIEMGLFPRMQGIIVALEERVERLPQGPSFPAIREVQSLREFPNLCILVAEERSEHGQELAELGHLTITDRVGSVLFDHDLPPLQATSLSFARQHSIPLSTADTEAIAVMTALWPDLLSVIRGRFLLSEDIILTQVQLMVTAERFDLEVPVVIGESMVMLYQKYLTLPVSREVQGAPFPIDLLTLVRQFGIPFPGSPHLSALDRAMGILHVLHAMAQGLVPKSSLPSTPGRSIDEDCDQ